MNYKESDYITEQYSEMSIARLKFTIQNRDEYLSAHVERCEQELKSRGL